nr:MAG TPA: major capsid protein [Caudoviricetes sp.]DAS47970.1 MAG TPA: major capsid protein [Caudoviricetes sp.]
MNLQELLDAINAKKAEVKDLAEQGKIAEAKIAKEELVNLQEQYNILKDIVEEEQTGVSIENFANALAVKIASASGSDAIHDFAEAARHGFYTNTMTEGTKADGGYTVPEDIQTKINQYKKAVFSLESLVDVETVKTSSGRRTFQKKAQAEGFKAVAEAGKIQGNNTPQFEILDYTIKKYAGYMPVTSELLADSDANITAVLTKWLAEEDIATKNAQILTAIATKAETDLKNLDGIKKAINVTLGAAYAGSVVIVTNDDGLNYLDTLVDKQGRYLLSPDVQNPMQMVLAVGARKIPIRVVPNAILATKTNKIPFIIGDLKEAVKIFDRAKLNIMTSNVAAVGTLNAFEQDLTLFRGIERFDCKTKDADAFVNGYITVTP